MENGKYVWDITCWNEGLTAATIKGVLTQYAKKWAFQKEQGLKDLVLEAAAATPAETKDEEKAPMKIMGKVHWQIRVSLLVKLRQNELIALLATTCLRGAHVSLTSTENHKGFDYVLKDATRVEGPWTDKTDGTDEKAEEPTELKGVTLYPWQQAMVDLIKTPVTKDNRRTVNVLYDPMGNTGKSFLRKYLEWNKLAVVMPTMKDVKDIMRWAMGNKGRAYVFDMPRNTLKGRMGDFWMGVECLKDGRPWEDRYKPKAIQMADNPHVWVLCNDMPDQRALIGDRWGLWTIGHDNTMVNIKDMEHGYLEKLVALRMKRRMKAREESQAKRPKLNVADLPEE